MQVKINCIIFCILPASDKKQGKADNHKEGEEIKSGKHFAVFNTPWWSTNVLLDFPLCLLLLFPPSTEKKPQSSSENSLMQEETTSSTILRTVCSSTHSNLDSANVSGHDMHSFQTITHSLPTKSMPRPETSILMMFFYVNLTVNKSLLYNY